jgi:hypothetical protein
MATEAQVLANRLNAQKSTGPRTAEGKAAVSQNAVKHGLSARLDVIKGEDQAEFDRHREAMLGELAPVGAMEAMLAERVVNLSWRLKRVERTQNEAFDALLADRSSPLAKLVQSLSPKGAGRVEGGPDGEGDLALGRVALKDFSNSRVLDRLLMYERRIEHSLYRTMAELQRLRLVRELDAPAEESAEGVSSLKFQVSSGESQSSILQTSHFTLNTSEETPHGVTTNAPAAGVSPPAEMLHHSNIPSFQHSIHGSGCPAVEDPSCKTNPISPGPSEGQVLCDEGIMNNVAENSCEETKPICPGGLVVCP